MDTLTTLIESYGYIAIFVSAVVEGEPVVVLGGVSAMAGLLSFPVVVGLAALGAYVGDIAYFYLGRYGGDYAHRKLPKLTQATHKPIAFATKYPRLLSFGMRFMYGFRNIVPICIGAAPVPVSIFLIWNALGSLVWSITIAGIGYLAGDPIIAFFKTSSGMYLRIAIAILVIYVIAKPLYHIVKELIPPSKK